MSRSRLLPLVLVCLLATFVSTARAQVRPMTWTPPDSTPPIIWLLAGAWEVYEATPYLEIEFCDRYSLNASSRWIKLNGQTVTGSFSYVYGDGTECEWSSNAVSSTSSLTLALGNNTLQAHICDNASNCKTQSWTIRRVVRAAPLVALHNLNSDDQDRGLCLTLGAGQAAGLSCGDLFVTHSLPAYRTMGRDRSLTLFYSSALAAPRPVVAVWVTQDSATAPPTTVYAQLTVGGAVRASASYYGWSSTAGTRQVALTFDAAAAGLGSGIHSFSLLIRNQYDGATNDTTVTGEILVASRTGSEFGSGWWIGGLEQLVLSQSGNRILWLGGDGSAAVYDSVAAATWVRAAGPFRDTLTLSGGVYTRRLRHHVQVKFDATGRHLQTVDRAGRVTQFAWDTVNGHTRLVSITVPKVSGTAQTYSFGYQGASALLAYTQDPAGRRMSPSVATSTSYGTTITYIDDADNGRTSFAYDSFGRMTGRTNRRNYRTAFAYANDLHVTRVAIPLNPASSDSARDSSRTHIAWWDERGLAVGQVGTTLSGAATDTVYTKVSGPRVSVADDATFWLDRWGAPTQIVGAVHDTVVVQRSTSTGLVSKLETPVHQVWGLTYDARGNLLTATDSTHEGGGADTAVTTSYVYADGNAPDSPTLIRSPVDTTAFAYHPTLGLPSLVTRQGGGRTRFAWDSTGLLRSVTDSGVRVVDTTTWGRTNAHLTTSFAYDSLGNDTSLTAPSGRRTRYVRDLYARPVLVYDPAGHRIDYAYDILNRDTAVTVWDSAALTTHYYHSPTGRIDSILDPRLVAQRWFHDAADRDTLSKDEAGAGERHIFGSSGLLDTLRTRAGYWIVYRYDEGGRPVRMDYPSRTINDSVVPGDSITRTFDAAGRLRSASTTSSLIRYGYYREGTVRADSQLAKSGSTVLVNVVMRYWYDLGGRRTRFVNGTDTLTYAYGADGLLDTLAVRWGTSGLAADTFRLTWDRLGRRDSVVYVAPGAHVSYGYDVDGRLRMVCSRHPGNGQSTDQLEHELRYTSLDADGLPSGLVRYAGGNQSSDSTCTSQLLVTLDPQQSLSYDARHQLREDRTYRYSYDSSGNRLTRRWTTDNTLLDSLRYDPSSNRALARFWQGAGWKNGYSHDADGTIYFESQTTSGSRRYFLNAIGQMTGHMWHDGVGWPHRWIGFASNCAYDALGRRVNACGAGWLGFDGDNAVLNLGSSSQPTWRYIHGPGLDDPLVAAYQESPNSYQKRYYLTDGRGRLLAFTNASGDTNYDTSNDYFSHGGAQAGGIRASHTFENGRDDSPAAPELSFYRNRYYDQRTGRWTQEDPIGVAGGVNLYAFVGNNPTTFTDPFGLRVCFSRGGRQQLLSATEDATGSSIALDDQGCISSITARDTSFAFTWLRDRLQYLSSQEETYTVSFTGRRARDSRFDPHGRRVAISTAPVFQYNTWGPDGTCNRTAADYGFAGAVAHELLGHAFDWSSNMLAYVLVREQSAMMFAENIYFSVSGRPPRCAY